MSGLMSLIPSDCFDVYVLRTSKQSLVVVLSRLEEQYGPCRATESIQEVIRALNLTMQDVEEAWRVWRHDYVRATLRSGFMYIKARIRAACWRRYQGRSPAAFVEYQSLYPAFRYAGTTPSNDQSLVWQAEGSVAQVGEVYQYAYGNPGDYAYPVQAGDAQYSQYSPAPAPTSAAPQQYYAPPQSTAPSTRDYLPPPYPPPQARRQQQQQQTLVPHVNAVQAPGCPPMSQAVAAAVEVATRFLEAANKAVSICIELNAM